MKIVVVILLMSLTLFSSCWSRKPKAIECTALSSLENEVKTMFNADNVIIESKWLKEELYFKGISCFYVTIINGETNTLNFKKLSNDKYERFDNYQEIENGLKDEGIQIVEKISDKCELSYFDQIVIVFAKEKLDGTLFYRFGNVYKT